MHGDLENLYEAHAHRLYAHCWSLVGDQGAPSALKDTLNQAAQHPPPGETVLWLHHLARTVCTERGAFSRHSRPVFAEADIDPLLSAARNLPADHREALLLSAGEWLEVRDIARVLRLSTGAVRERLHEARTALERVVLDALMRGTADPAKHMDVIAAFERGRLPNLLARRAPAFAPAPVRDYVLGDQALDGHEPNTHALDDDALGEHLLNGDVELGHAPSVPVPPAVPPDPTRPLVVIGSGAEPLPDLPDLGGPDRARRRRAALKGVGGVAGVAASIAVGLMMTWPSPDDGTVNALGPPPDTNTSPGGPAPGGGVTEEPSTPKPPSDGGQRNAAPAPAPSTEKRTPATEKPSDPGGGETDPTTPPADDTPSSPPTSSPPAQESPSPPAQSPPPGDREDGSDSDGPLDPVTDIIGGVTSPILGGLTG
ncbi:sigma factor-like helix-turn-helix DNA-binding protein [Actinomadura sp. 9N215]|uniref:RNA polymerase sigma factor n=1 Tax=Actinomadura sp. 9N215 TaxID=3375150 RepID=UPI003794E34F